MEEREVKLESVQRSEQRLHLCSATPEGGDRVHENPFSDPEFDEGD